MNLFRTKDGEIFNLDDISRIKKYSPGKKDGEWNYQVIPSGTVNTGNALCCVVLDKEDYDTLVNYLYNTCGDKIGCWDGYEFDDSDDCGEYYS